MLKKEYLSDDDYDDISSGVQFVVKQNPNYITSWYEFIKIIEIMGDFLIMNGLDSRCFFMTVDDDRYDEIRIDILTYGKFNGFYDDYIPILEDRFPEILFVL